MSSDPIRCALAVLILSFARSHSQVTPALEASFPFPTGTAMSLVDDGHGGAYACSGSSLVGYFYSQVHWFQAARFDAAGNTLWTYDYQPAGGFNERATWVTSDSQGNALVVGHALTSQSADRDVVVLKIDPAGHLLWERRWNGGPGGNVGWRIDTDAADDVYVLASGAPAGTTLQIVKWSSNGAFQWAGMVPTGTAPIRANALAVRPDGTSAAFAGVAQSSFLTASFSPTGALLWTDTFATGLGGGRDAVFDPAGPLYVCGSGTATGSSTVTGVIIKYDTSGNRVWEFGANHPSSLSGSWDSYDKLAIDPAGDVIAAGRTHLVNLYTDWVVTKIDAVGALNWTTTYDGFGGNDEGPVALAVDGAGSAHVAGAAGGSGLVGPCFPSASDVDTFVIEWDATGSLTWSGSAPCSGRPTALALAPGGGAFVSTPSTLAIWPRGINLVLHQPMAGSPVGATLLGVVPGHEIATLVSTEPAPGGTGTGPYLGLWASNPAPLLFQYALPVGSDPFRIQAGSATVVLGPYPVPAGLTLEAVSFDVTSFLQGNGLNPTSVAALFVQ